MVDNEFILSTEMAPQVPLDILLEVAIGLVMCSISIGSMSGTFKPILSSIEYAKQYIYYHISPLDVPPLLQETFGNSTIDSHKH